MHIAEFALERYFARWEFAVRHVLCASDVEPLSLSELLALADGDGRRRWETLRLGYTETAGMPALREEIAALYDGLGATMCSRSPAGRKACSSPCTRCCRRATTLLSCGP